ncbi:MAG: arsenic resistance protein, partial [Thermomicrobiales bacterium]
ILLMGAIACGSLIGTLSGSTGESLGSLVDYTVLTLVSLLFFELRLESLRASRANLRFIAVAWIANFVLIPAIGFAVATVFLTGKPLFFTGLVIYFMAPCTDWFLGFTRMAKGNASLGASLIPINMISEILLFPLYLTLFTRWQTGSLVPAASGTLTKWFLIPFIVAVTLHYLLRLLLPSRTFDRLLDLVGRTIPLVIAALVVEIFAANIPTLRDHVAVFGLILVAVFIFFLSTYLLGEGISRVFRFDYPEHALLAMTTAARNAPFMLGGTAAAIPNQPLIYAALIIGMLVEFPHLTALKHILLRKRAASFHQAPPSVEVVSHASAD